MSSYLFAALHGFLGQPADWEKLELDRLKAVDLFKSTNWNTLWNWAKQFNLSSSKDFSSSSVIMGYSLGGRLALHALIENPARWKAAVIISAHPGLQNRQEKESRLKRDQQWGERFKQDKWDLLMADWNSQAVFSSDGFTFTRQEKDFNRLHLAYFLEHASLGRQDNLSFLISKLPMPIIWLVGEKDQAYCQLSEKLNFSHPYSQRCIVSKAGHRLPWEQPDQFKQFISQFLIQIGL